MRTNTMPGKKSTPQDSLTLNALLSSIETDTAPFLAKSLQEMQEKAKGEARHQVLHITFTVGAMDIALSINSIQEIGYMPSISPLPHVPQWITGITHIRGEIFSMVDLKLLFAIPNTKESAPAAYYILIASGSIKFGIPINQITGIHGLDESRDPLTPHPMAQTAGANDLAAYIRGRLQISNRNTNVLDADKLLHSSVISEFR